MSVARQKRARSSVEDVDIPPEDCTRDTFDQHANLNDRQFLCWALQTEARVRFAKLEGRDNAVGESTTLNSEYLLDLYPTNGDEPVGKGPLARERYTFARKSLPYLQDMCDPDSSLETLTRVTIDRPQSSDLAKKTTRGGPQYLPIPPNLLYFELILEAFMGYSVPSFQSKDPTQPRAAIMGGAVVATITSWRDKKVISIFKQKETAIQEALQDDNKESYESAKKDVGQALHRYFLHEDGPRSWRRSDVVYSNSPFSLGDVDIFLQSSPSTRCLMNKMKELPAEVRDMISQHLGGSGFVHRDLEAFSIQLCGGHLEPQFSDTVTHHWERGKKFCYALTANGLSFALGAAEEVKYYGREFDAATDRWPRTTQLIMLNEKADIVGGLMDFDISVASCAYDGVGVYATPRAAFSLKTMIQVATPFVYEEKRNRTRIKKYYQRGFDAYIVDPYCSHDEQCFKEDTILAQQAAAESEDETELKRLLPDVRSPHERIEVVTVKDGVWAAASLNDGDKYEEISQAQLQDGWEGRFICDLSDSRKRHYYHPYSIALIEKSPGHAIEYFAKRDNWSEEEREEVSEIPEHQRFACRECRKDYGLSLVLDKAPADLTSEGTVEDVLHGEWSYRHSTGFCGDFDPSFYSGGAFNSFFVGTNARSWDQLLGVMRSQHRIEEARYIRRHGTIDGYQERFVYGGNREHIFNDASEKNLSPNGRAPVGLNPERFIAKCKDCKEWLHECEFSVEYCERCEGSKPAAVND